MATGIAAASVIAAATAAGARWDAREGRRPRAARAAAPDCGYCITAWPRAMYGDVRRFAARNSGVCAKTGSCERCVAERRGGGATAQSKVRSRDNQLRSPASAHGALRLRATDPAAATPAPPHPHPPAHTHAPALRSRARRAAMRFSARSVCQAGAAQVSRRGCRRGKRLLRRAWRTALPWIAATFWRDGGREGVTAR